MRKFVLLCALALAGCATQPKPAPALCEMQDNMRLIQRADGSTYLSNMEPFLAVCRPILLKGKG